MAGSPATALIAERAEAAEPTVKADEGAKPETPEIPTEKATEGEDSVVTLSGIEKEGDKYVIRIPNSTTVYKGDTVDEVIKQVVQGASEKDRVIREQKAREMVRSTNVPTEGEEGEDAEDIPEPPVESEIVAEVMGKYKESGIRPEMLRFKDADWDQYQDEHGLKDRHVLRLQSLTEQARGDISGELGSRNKQWLNLRTVVNARQRVVEILTESGIEPDTFAEEYREVLTEVLKASKNGLLDGGEIDTAVAKRVIRMVRERGSAASASDEDKKRLQKLKETIGSGGKSGSNLSRRDKEASSISEATANIKAAIRAGRY